MSMVPAYNQSNSKPVWENPQYTLIYSYTSINFLLDERTKADYHSKNIHWQQHWCSYYVSSGHRYWNLNIYGSGSGESVRRHVLTGKKTSGVIISHKVSQSIETLNERGFYKHNVWAGKLKYFGQSLAEICGWSCFVQSNIGNLLLDRALLSFD